MCGVSLFTIAQHLEYQVRHHWAGQTRYNDMGMPRGAVGHPFAIKPDYRMKSQEQKVSHLYKYTNVGMSYICLYHIFFGHLRRKMTL